MYELFEHTADLGLRIEAGSLPELLREGARGLAAMIVLHPERLEPRRQWVIELPPGEPDYLLFDWLNELLYRFDTERLLPAEVAVELNDSGLRGVCRGERFEEARHGGSHEVKAITYHGLVVSEQAGRWRAEVIVDI